MFYDMSNAEMSDYISRMFWDRRIKRVKFGLDGILGSWVLRTPGIEDTVNGITLIGDVCYNPVDYIGNGIVPFFVI